MGNYDDEPGLYRGEQSFKGFILSGDYRRVINRLSQKITCFRALKLMPYKHPEEVVFCPPAMTSTIASTYRGPMQEGGIIYAAEAPQRIPVQEYEEFVRRVKSTAPFIMDLSWEKRYRGMVGILKPSKNKTTTDGSGYLETLQYREFMYNMAYDLCWKMADADESNLAQALSLEIEMERYIWDYA